MFEIYRAPIHGEEVYKHLPRDAIAHVRDAIAHLRDINILAWFRGFRVKIANFSSFFCPSIPKRDLATKKNNTKYRNLT